MIQSLLDEIEREEDLGPPGDDNSLGVLRVLQSIWRGRIGTPKTKRSKAVVPLIPQVCGSNKRECDLNV